jgi:hypothetical protein
MRADAGDPHLLTDHVGTMAHMECSRRHRGDNPQHVARRPSRHPAVFELVPG